MGLDDGNEGNDVGECVEHMWVPDEFEVVTRNGVTGMAIVNRCTLCGAVFYEPSNVDKFPDTNGLDPRLY